MSQDTERQGVVYVNPNVCLPRPPVQRAVIQYLGKARKASLSRMSGVFRRMESRRKLQPLDALLSEADILDK